MKKISFLVGLLILSAVGWTQSRNITGKVVDESNEPVEGATIQIKGRTGGTAAGVNGLFAIQADNLDVLLVSAVNYGEIEVPVGSSNEITVVLSRSEGMFNEVVVTALGLTRNRNQLPYAAQQISGAEINRLRSTNVGSSLSGKISGLEIRQNNAMGGSTNIVIRGAKSLTGTNQALFVIDGVPFDNTNNNARNQREGRGGYDYGNAAADINPDDVETVTVLKGAAATALYGSRGSNGVIVITTKKGKKGLGVTLNTGVSVGKIDKSTFLKYQRQYGGGYGQFYEDPSGYYLYRDIDGNGTDDLVMPTSEDASYGGPFDPNLQVYQWDAFDPTSPNFGKQRPWVAAANTPESFFENQVTLNNSVFIDGGSDRGSFKLGYTRSNDKGILPNSQLNKDLLNFSSTYNITPKLTAQALINFTKIKGVGRYGSGYDSKNPMTNMRQWWQMNVDVKEQEEAYLREKKNVTWNWQDPDNLVPIYWDNIYWSRYENFQNDERSRYQGYASLNYKVTSWLNVLGRVGLDSYDEMQEERIAIGSVAGTIIGQLYKADGEPSAYGRFNRTFRETNYDLLINVDKDLGTNFNFKALLGSNIRKTNRNSIAAKTNGGLIIPKLYTLANTANPLLAPIEVYEDIQVNGVFAGATLSYKDFLTVDATIRRDESSTLPTDNNDYYYPSVSAGLVFSNLMKNLSWLSYGKLRANYAEVGSDAPAYSVTDAYDINASYGSNSLTAVDITKNNPNLLPERTKSYEFGVEASFLNARAGFDITYYNTRTVDQILPVTVSRSTGYSSIYVNAGTIENQGVELSLFGSPVKTKNFSWTVNLNWTRNRNKVIELYGENDNLVLASFQGGVSINASLGQPYGTIRGVNFVYLNGQRTVNPTTGRYVLSPTSNEVIGNANPDWIGGINNTFRYKNISLSFLIDMRHGGDVFSLDLYYGLATGLPAETAGLNDLGNPLRSPVEDGGGIIRPGLQPDGKVNDVRVSAVNFGAYGYRYAPAADFVYDASYVKLRELVLTYSLPDQLISRMSPFKGLDISLLGRNLWLIHKNLPYADPEENISSGNLQGYQGGAYPTVRSVGANLKFRF